MNMIIISTRIALQRWCLCCLCPYYNVTLIIDIRKIRIKMQMSVARVPLPTIVVVDSDKSAEDQLRTMITLYRCAYNTQIEVLRYFLFLTVAP